MPKQAQMQFQIEDAQIMFRNFAGVERTFNPAGARNFAVQLPPDVAEQMASDGWNVKATTPREEGDEIEFYIQVKVKYDFKPPRIVMITSRGRQPLDESTVEMLDYADIEKVDLICNGSHWSNNGKEGIAAYLKTMFVIINEDDLERKYAEALSEVEV